MAKANAQLFGWRTRPKQLSLPLSDVTKRFAWARKDLISERLSQSRRLLAWFGVGGLVLGAALHDGPFAIGTANLTLAVLSVTLSLAWIEGIWSFRPQDLVDSESRSTEESRWALGASVLAAIVACQSWFRSGTAIAVGDVPPPNGTAWISRLFEPWAWSGANLGGPAALELELPWAAVLGAVHFMGGSPELAQRIWYTLLFAGIAAASCCLLMGLSLRPNAAIVGALAYVFSPFVVANAAPNPVLLAAMTLMAALPAVVVARATKRIRLRTAVFVFALTAPLLGFVYNTPPLLGIVVAETAFTPLIVGWLFGRAALYRGFALLGLGLLLATALSAYWIVPTVLQLVNSLPNQLAPLSSWSWTEGRAVIRNALWLNSVWGWSHQEYYPFAAVYDSPPFSLIRFAPAVIAFTSLTSPNALSSPQAALRLRLATVAASIAVAVIFLSTGTNPPGNVVFDWLYARPLGWLLREPNRYLVVADLMYSILIAVATERLLQVVVPRPWSRQLVRASWSVAAPALVIALVVLPGWPIVTGASISDNRPGLPPMHVQLPGYWGEMTAYMDRLPGDGAVLVLPLDDFYQMPYTWGYDGSDQFIVELTSRRILNPTTGYFSATDELTSAVSQTQRSVISDDWLVTDRLLRALGAPFVLVRGDLDTAAPGRSFVQPTALDAALLKSPNFELLHSSGPLMLFGLRDSTHTDTRFASYYATVNTLNPDLRVLSRLPAGAALVSSQGQANVPFVQELPPMSEWDFDPRSHHLKWTFVETPGWKFGLVQLDTRAGLQPIDDLIARPASSDAITASRSTVAGTANKIEIGLATRDVLAGGSFAGGLWESKAICRSVGGSDSQPESATVTRYGGPTGGPYLRLSSASGVACQSRHLSWQQGSIIVTILVRHESGDGPHICLWEVGPSRCASAPSPLSDSSKWTTYKATVTPDSGTSELDLIVYVSGSASGPSVNDFADVRVVELPLVSKMDLLGTPPTASTTTLLVDESSYSREWQGPAGSEHVLVDGIMNGWLVQHPDHVTTRYTGGRLVIGGFGVSALAALITLCLALSLTWLPSYIVGAFNLSRPRKAIQRRNRPR